MLATQPTLAVPPALSGYAWHALQRENMPALHRMLVAADEVDGRLGVPPLDDLTQQLDDPWCNTATDSLLALAPDGQVAAVARVYADPQPDPAVERRAYLEGTVHPAHRGRGLGTFILNWMQDRGRERLAAMPGDRPRILRAGCCETAGDRVALHERQGFRRVRYFCRMRRDLREPIPEPQLPAGLVLQSYRPELDEGMRIAFNEAFRDHWDFQPATAVDWQMYFSGQATFRPELNSVVTAGDEVVGTGICTVNADQNARQDFSEGWISALAVRRRWRKHGVASAMLCEAMRRFRAAGLDYAALGVDTENPSGALGIYTRLGFVPFQRVIVFAKEIDGCQTQRMP
jgi:mycothiol synthase